MLVFRKTLQAYYIGINDSGLNDSPPLILQFCPNKVNIAHNYFQSSHAVQPWLDWKQLWAMFTLFGQKWRIKGGESLSPLPMIPI